MEKNRQNKNQNFCKLNENFKSKIQNYTNPFLIQTNFKQNNNSTKYYYTSNINKQPNKLDFYNIPLRNNTTSIFLWKQQNDKIDLKSKGQLKEITGDIEKFEIINDKQIKIKSKSMQKEIEIEFKLLDEFSTFNYNIIQINNNKQLNADYIIFYNNQQSNFIIQTLL